MKKTKSQIWMRPYGWGVEPPYFAVFRNIFEVAEPVVLRFSYSADERATLFCDGEVIADGPPRGTPERWFTAAVELPLAPGKHILTAAFRIRLCPDCLWPDVGQAGNIRSR